MKFLWIVAIVGYFAIGFLQFFAIMDGLEVWLGVPGILAAITAVFLAWIPLAGQILGFLSAWHIWDWHPFAAFALFFWPLIPFLVLGPLAAMADAADGLLQKRA